MYAVYDYWHTSPQFFIIRVGMLMVILTASYAWCRWGAGQWGFSPLIQLGQASLLVYWVHIEFVYGRVSILAKHAQTIGRRLSRAAGDFPCDVGAGVYPYAREGMESESGCEWRPGEDCDQFEHLKDLSPQRTQGCTEEFVTAEWCTLAYQRCPTKFTTSRSAQRPSSPCPSGASMNAQWPPSSVSM